MDKKIITPDIIITAPPDETHVQMVCKYLQEKHPDISVYILDTMCLPQKVNSQYFLNTRKLCIDFFNSREYTISCENLKSVWWWRARSPAIDKRIVDVGCACFAYRECCQMLEGLWYILDCVWVNQPERQEVASNLIYQLQAARMVGFHIPETLVTNRPDEVLAFLEQHQYQVICRQLLPSSSKTFLVTQKEIKNIGQLVLAPIMFQEALKLDAWINVLVLGEAVFSVRVLQSMETKQPIFKKYLLPNEIKIKILTLTRYTGLVYCKLNMGIDKNGNYVFLDLDSSAPFMNMEEQAGLHITELMGELLLRGRVKESQRVWPTLPKLQNVTSDFGVFI